VATRYFMDYPLYEALLATWSLKCTVETVDVAL
jgi:hypothetical protein